MVSLKNSRELAAMRDACRISAQALQYAGEIAKAGMTTGEIDSLIRRFIEKQGAKPSFLGYGGFPGSACLSVNEQVIHGIPGKRVLKDGDILSVDVGAFYNGYHGDNAYTFPIGTVSDDAKQLMETTKRSLEEAIKQAIVGNRIGDIGATVASVVEERGFSVVRQFVGHGVGTNLHEDPSVPNFGTAGRGPRLLPGMTIAIEPMVNQGVSEVEILSDGWTTVTKDRKLSAHFEHTIAITTDGPVILTLP